MPQGLAGAAPVRQAGAPQVCRRLGGEELIEISDDRVAESDVDEAVEDGERGRPSRFLDDVYQTRFDPRVPR
jgi:hypothetical protein